MGSVKENLGGHRANHALQADFFSWEDTRAGDFPYYQGAKRVPVWGWVVILVGVALGLAADFAGNSVVGALPQAPALRIPIGILMILAVPGLPLLAVWVAAGSQIGLLFRRLRGKEWILIAVLALLSGLWSVVMNKLLGYLGQQSVGDAAVAKGSGALKSNLGTFVELPFLILGEALFVVLPFLAVFALLNVGLKVARKPAIVTAALIACLAFGMYHFKAYDWHWAQMLVTIGLGQLIILFGYLKTKNILVTYLAHLLLDWAIVGLAIVVALAGNASAA